MKNNRSAGRRVAMGGILVLALLQVWDAAGVELPKPTVQQYSWQEQERIQFVCLDRTELRIELRANQDGRIFIRRRL